MAVHGDTNEQASTMDISEHLRTWKGFTSLVKWATLAIGAVMLFLLVFRTHG